MQKKTLADFDKLEKDIKARMTVLLASFIRQDMIKANDQAKLSKTLGGTGFTYGA